MSRETKLDRDQKYRDTFMMNLRAEMARSCVSVRGLAKMCGYSPSAIVRYRNGDWDVPVTRAYRMSEALGCSIYDLIPEVVE